MKFALYIEPFTAFEQSFYTKELLVESFKQYGHELTIFVPIQKFNLSKALSNYSEKYPDKSYDVIATIEKYNFSNDTYDTILEMLHNKVDPLIIINKLSAKEKTNKKDKKLKNKLRKQLKKKLKREKLNKLNDTSANIDVEKVDLEVKNNKVDDNVDLEVENIDDKVDLEVENNNVDLEVDDNKINDNNVDDNNVDDDKVDDVKVDEEKVDEEGIECYYVKNSKKKYHKIDNSQMRSQFIKTIDRFSDLPYVKTYFPEPKDYDVLMITDTFTKNWYMGANGKITDQRSRIATSFTQAGKKVVCINDSPLIEYRFLKGLYHGISGDIAKKCEEYIPSYTHCFKMPLISNMGITKNESLSRDDFYKKYDIPLDKKLIVILPGKIAKWKKSKKSNDNQKTVVKNVMGFYSNLDNLNNIMNEKGYVMVSKLHARDDYYKWMRDTLVTTLRMDLIKYIDPLDSYELLKYSDRGISFGTTMVYQTYLFDLPVLEIGSGKYYMGWGETNTSMSNSMLIDYNYGTELIYGTLASNFDSKPIKILEKFLDTKFNIDDFKYKKNHPIYGNSYGTNINDVTKAILKHLKIWKKSE